MNISFKDFQKLDIRIGTVVKAEIPKWSHWVMKLVVDIGQLENGESPSTRSARSGRKPKLVTVFAGIMKHYKPEEIKGKQVVVVVNLEPKKIGPEGDYSEAMVLAASVPDKSGKEEDEKPVLLSVSEKVPNGTKVR